MKKPWKWLWWTLFSVVFTVLSWLTVLVFVIHRIAPNMSSCVAEQHVISRNARGDEVEMHQDICGGMAYSDTVTLSVIMKKSGARGEVFSYERNNSEPIINWISDGVLEVSLQDTGKVYKKKDHFGGIIIRYSSNPVK